MLYLISVEIGTRLLATILEDHMQHILNSIFPNGNLIIMAMFFVAIMFGSGMGLTLQRTKMKGGIAILMLAATAVSFTGYQATVTLTEADQPLAMKVNVPTYTTSPQEMVYAYGQDEPITRAEHEQLLALSAGISEHDDATPRSHH